MRNVAPDVSGGARGVPCKILKTQISYRSFITDQIIVSNAQGARD